MPEPNATPELKNASRHSSGDDSARLEAYKYLHPELTTGNQ
jgi:hypothetical protein